MIENDAGMEHGGDMVRSNDSFDTDALRRTRAARAPASRKTTLR